MKFVRADWKPGAHRGLREEQGLCAAQRASRLVVGRQGRCNFDRIEWVIMPDPATASAALQNGEIDWWESPITDLVPVLKRNRNIKVDIADPLGNIGSFRLNHLHPPFNNVKVRRAVQMALSQEDYMRAVVGSDTKPVEHAPELLHAGHAALHRGRRRAAQGPARHRRRQEAAGRGRLQRPARDLPRRPGPAAAQGHGRDHRRPAEEDRHDGRLRRHRLGHGRPAPRLQEPAGPGRLGHVPHLACRRRLREPGGHIAVRAGGEKGPAWFGWPDDPAVEKDVADWFDAKTSTRRRPRWPPSTRPAMASVTYIPTGFYKSLPGLAQQRRRRRQRPAAVVLGREEGVMTPAVFAHRRVRGSRRTG